MEMMRPVRLEHASLKPGIRFDESACRRGGRRGRGGRSSRLGRGGQSWARAGLGEVVCSRGEGIFVEIVAIVLLWEIGTGIETRGTV
jgi:hypothetical protein